MGKNHPFEIFEDESVDTYLAAIEGEERRGGAAQQKSDEADDKTTATSMETDS